MRWRVISDSRRSSPLSSTTTAVLPSDSEKARPCKAQGFELRRHQAVTVLIQVEKTQDGDEEDEDVDQKNAPGEGRMPALPTPESLDLTRHVAIFIADVKPLNAAAEVAIAP